MPADAVADFLSVFAALCRHLETAGDDDAADAIRDRLDTLWYKMTDSEQAAARLGSHAASAS